MRGVGVIYMEGHWMAVPTEAMPAAVLPHQYFSSSSYPSVLTFFIIFAAAAAAVDIYLLFYMRCHFCEPNLIEHFLFV